MLTLYGRSSDNRITDCVVYGHYNSLVENAVPNRVNDYSTWSLTFNLAQARFNNIRVELSCPGLAASQDNIVVHVVQPERDEVSNGDTGRSGDGDGGGRPEGVTTPAEEPGVSMSDETQPPAEDPGVDLDTDTGDNGDNGEN
jgi:hypothetical protein